MRDNATPLRGAGMFHLLWHHIASFRARGDMQDTARSTGSDFGLASRAAVCTVRGGRTQVCKERAQWQSKRLHFEIVTLVWSVLRKSTIFGGATAGRFRPTANRKMFRRLSDTRTPTDTRSNTAWPKRSRLWPLERREGCGSHVQVSPVSKESRLLNWSPGQLERSWI